MGPGPNTKGGGYHGGPKRWSGAGPAPARHVPWPEIFKHHISLIEGHLKMVDMVRKHTVEGTGNYRTIMGCVNRCKDMLQEAKQVSRSFIEPPNLRERVPLGSSSASMYPGYSPADHEYGKAAEEYGRTAAEARAKGIDIKHPDVDYEIGQAKGVKRRTLAAMREAKSARESGSGSGTGSGSDGAMNTSSTKPTPTTTQPSKVNVEDVPATGDNPYFVIDTKPTPVSLTAMMPQTTKRSASPPSNLVEGKKHKKAKKTHDGAMPTAEETNGSKYEDISEEVDARLKEKEEKQRRKEEKKRKRQSEGEPVASTVAPGTGDPTPEVEMQTKKKKKVKHENEVPTEKTISKKRSGNNAGSEDGDGNERKKRKKSKDVAEAAA